MQAEGSAAPGATAVRSTGFLQPGESSQVFTRSPRTSTLTADLSPQIVVARRTEELARHRAALDDLAADTLEANVFYEPILAEAAVRSLGAGRRLRWARREFTWGPRRRTQAETLEGSPA